MYILCVQDRGKATETVTACLLAPSAYICQPGGNMCVCAMTLIHVAS